MLNWNSEGMGGWFQTKKKISNMSTKLVLRMFTGARLLMESGHLKRVHHEHCLRNRKHVQCFYQVI